MQDLKPYDGEVVPFADGGLARGFNPQNLKPYDGEVIPFDKKQERGFGAAAKDTVQDLGVSLAHGSNGLLDMGVAAADMTGQWLGLNDGGNRSRNTLKGYGFDPNAWGGKINEAHTEGYKQSQQEMQNAHGLWDKAKVALSHPIDIVANTVVESLPSMAAGGALGAGAKLATAGRIGDVAASALGEGAVSGLQTAAQIQNDTGHLTADQALAALGSGALTGLLGAGAGKAARRMGIDDADTAMVGALSGGRQAASGAANQGVLKSAAKGFLSEGVLEELPQSLQEQAAQNIAEGKDWREGLDDAAVMGVLSGGIMGGGFNAAGAAKGSLNNMAQNIAEKRAAKQAERQSARQNAQPESVQPERADVPGSPNNAAQQQAQSEAQAVRQPENNTQRQPVRQNEQPEMQAVQQIETEQSEPYAQPESVQSAPVETPETSEQPTASVETAGQMRPETESVRPETEMKVSERMGLNADAGMLSAAAVQAVDNAQARETLNSVSQNGHQAGPQSVIAKAQAAGAAHASGGAEAADTSGGADVSGSVFDTGSLNTPGLSDNPNASGLTASGNAPKAKLQGANSEVDIGGGEYGPVQWEVVEASDLGATLGKAENQFRDRTRQGSQEQIRDMAANLDPRKLGDSPVMDYGAPTLAKDGATIIGGNGRTAAIQQAYQSGKGNLYRQSLVRDAGKYGLDANAVKQFKQPVLVRRLKNDVDIRKAAIASNENGGLQMSSLELAKTDATRLPDLGSFAFDGQGSLNTAGNRKAIADFAGAFPVNQRAALQDADGMLSREGLRRLENAMLYRAYGDSPTLARLIDSTHQESRNMGNALMQASSTIAEAKADAQAGIIHDLDISQDLMNAADLIEQLRANGDNVQDYLAQYGLFGDKMTAVQRDLLAFLDKNVRSAKKIRGLIQNYYAAVRALGNPSQTDMFGNAAIPTRGQLLSRAINEQNGVNENQIDLFGQPETLTTDNGGKQNAGQPTEQQPAEQPTNERQAGADTGTAAAIGEAGTRPEGGRSDAAGVGENESGRVENKTEKGANQRATDLGKSVLSTSETSLARPFENNHTPSNEAVQDDVAANNMRLRQALHDFATADDFAQSFIDMREENNPTDAAYLDFVAGKAGVKSVKSVAFKTSLKKYWEKEAGAKREVEKAPTQKQIDDFVDDALAQNDPRGELPLWEVTPREADLVKRQADLDVSGMMHVLDAQELKHAMRRHKDDKTNAAKQPQENLTGEHLKRIPEVLRNFDSIEVQKRGNNRSSLIYKKEFKDGTIEYVERVFETSAKKNPRLSTKTIWVVSPIAATATTRRVYTPERQDNHTPSSNTAQQTNDAKAKEYRAAVDDWVEHTKSAADFADKAQEKSASAVETRSTQDGYIAGGKNRLLNILHDKLAEVNHGLSGNLNKPKSVPEKARAAKAKREAAAQRAAYDAAKAGGKTELSFGQWQQVRTPEFKAWFGDWENDPENASKIVNPKTGEPLVVYHGSISDFSVFEMEKAGKTDSGWYGKGFYTTPKLNTAQQYAGQMQGDTDGANLMPLFVNMRTPLVVRDSFDAPPEPYTVNGRPVLADGKKQYTAMFEEITKLEQANGADGTLVFKDGELEEIVVRQPAQLKSAVGNSGAFDADNPDIRFSRGSRSNQDVIADAGRKLKRLAQYIENGDRYISNAPIDLGKTPDVLVALGAEQLPLGIGDPKKLFQIVGSRNENDHGIGSEILAQVPDKLHEPLAVFTSKKQGLVAVLELRDNQNRPVIAAIHLSRKQGRNNINRVASIYGKDNARAVFREWRQEGLLRYLDNRKSREVLQSFGVQFPTEEANRGLGGNVLLPDDVVNFISAQSKRQRAQIQAALNNRLGEAAKRVRVASAMESAPDYAGKLIAHGVEGWFDPKTDSVVLAGENLKPSRAVWVAWHELGHRGVAVDGFADYRATMREAYDNPTVRKLAVAIAKKRAGKDGGVHDLASRDAAVATEEALVELFAAQQTGNYDGIKNYYGVSVPRALERGLRGLLARVAARLRNLFSHLLGKPMDSFSDADVFDLLDVVRHSYDGSLKHSGQQKNVAGVSEKPNGYMEITTGKDKGRYEHRAVAEAMIGRKLRADEVVHHKNGDKTDNRAENLQVLTYAEHAALHAAENAKQNSKPLGVPEKMKAAKAAKDHSGSLKLSQSESAEFARKASVLQGAPVYTVAERTAPIGNNALLRQWAAKQFERAGGKAVNPEIGEVVLNARAVKDTLSHGINPAKVMAFEAVPSVIGKGVVVTETEHGDMQSYFIAAPVNILGVDDIVTVLVRKDMNTQRMYIHSVTTKESLLNEALTGLNSDSAAVKPRGKLYSGDVTSILQGYLNYKPDALPDDGKRYSRAGGQLQLPEALPEDRRPQGFVSRMKAVAKSLADAFSDWKGRAKMSGRQVREQQGAFNDMGELNVGLAAYNAIGSALKPLLEKMKLANGYHENFTRYMRDYRATLNMAGQTARDLAEQGRDFTADERVMLSGILEKEISRDDVSPELLAVADKMRAVLSQQSDDLVRLGMLGKDSAERFRDTYLPRIYDRATRSGDSALDKLNREFSRALNGSMGKALNGQHLKGRGIFEIVGKTEQQAYENKGFEMRQDFGNQGRNAGKVLMWRDYTKSEREMMGEIRDAYLRFTSGYVKTQSDIAKGTLFQRVATDANLASMSAVDGWVQIPQTEIAGTGGVKRYGALSGMWVHPDVAYQLQQQFYMDNAIQKVWRSVLGWWKVSKTVYNPVAHVNNVMSNVAMMSVAGGLGNVKRAASAMKNKDALYREALQVGLVGDAVDASGVLDMFQGLNGTDGQVADGIISGSLKRIDKLLTRGMIGKIGGAMQTAYAAEDEVFKLALYATARDRGLDARQAREYATAFMFDYSEVPQGIKWVRDTGLLPFVSYTYKAVPAIARLALTRPHKVLALTSLIYGLNALSYALLGDAGDEDKEREYMPEYQQGYTAFGTPKLIRLPWNTDDGKPAFLDIFRWMPLGDFADTDNQMGGLPLPNSIMPNGPLVNHAAALLMNRDTFTGGNLTEDYMGSGEKAAVYAKWLAAQWLPASVGVPYSYHTNNVLDGLKNEFEGTALSDALEYMGYTGRTYRGEEKDLTRALTGAFGVKVRGDNAETLKGRYERKIGFEIREIRQDMAKIRKDMSMSVPARAAKLKERQARIAELFRQMQAHRNNAARDAV